MSVRNLDAIFRPRAVALIGASPRPNSVGLVTAQNLIGGGFAGPILFVNPKHDSVLGLPCYPSIASLTTVPDLAIVATPAETVPGLIGELGARGVKGAVVITAGFRELGNARGEHLERAMLQAAQPHLLRIVGPNCLGIVAAKAGLNASFAPGNALKGGIAFVAQSGAMVTTVLDWASAQGIGFSHLVSLGDMADVDFGDMLDYLANDAATTAILLYIEAVSSTRKFMSAARAAARLKPVIAIKAGRHAAAAKAATSHTGAMAGTDEVYDAAFRRAGILRVRDLDEIFDAVETLAMAPAISGDDMVILSNGGGAGVLATDSLLDAGARLTPLSDETLAKLNAVLPATWSRANPVDIIGDAPPNRYRDALDILLNAPETNAVLVLNCPTAVASGLEAARAIVEAAKTKHRPVLTNWLGGRQAAPARDLFTAARIPTFDTPTKAVRGFSHLVRYARVREGLLEVPAASSEAFAADDERARRILADACATGQVWLDEENVREILHCYGIATPRSAFAATAEEAAEQARAFGGVTALKIASPDITHKSDAGGVVLDLETPEAVLAAARTMRARVAQAVPRAKLSGFTVQEMIRRPGAHELIAGMAVDRQFGPFILFGQGGTAAEIIGDKAIALPPLNDVLARDLMAQTRVFKLLKGYRDHPPAALDAIALTLVKLSQLVCDLDSVAEIDINPLLADERGVMALDARIRIVPPGKDVRPGHRLAIRPYPKELMRAETIAGLGNVLLRPIRPADAEAVAGMFARLTPEDARLRFFTPLRSLAPQQLARLTQIDYDREMAFVLCAQGGDILGVARLAADPDNRQAEFAIEVRSDLHRKGLGRLLLTRLIDYARGRGLEELCGDVLRENAPMLALARAVGFSIQPSQSPELVRLLLRFRAS
jgi:acetyltransferase